MAAYRRTRRLYSKALELVPGRVIQEVGFEGFDRGLLLATSVLAGGRL